MPWMFCLKWFPMQSTLREYFESLVVTVILALFGTTFVVQAFKIPTPSMEDNLLVGDHLLVNKFLFARPDSWIGKLLPFREIKHGDIIVFKYPEDLTKNYVKRAIGLPGDRLRVAVRRHLARGLVRGRRSRLGLLRRPGRDRRASE